MGQKQPRYPGLGRQASGLGGGEMPLDLERIGGLQHQEVCSPGQIYQGVAYIRIPGIDQGAAFGLHPVGQAALGVIGGGALDHQALVRHLIRTVRGQFPEVHQARRRLHPARKGLHEPVVKAGKSPGGQKAEGLPPGVAQGVAGGEQKRHKVPHVVGMEVGQGQDVDGRKIQTVTQQGPEAPGAEVQNQEAAGGLEGQTRRPPAQRGHPGAGPNDG